MKLTEKLESVLCNPEGKACIGTMADCDMIDSVLDELRAMEKRALTRQKLEERNKNMVCPIMSRHYKNSVDITSFKIELHEVKCLVDKCMAWVYDKNTDTVMCKMMNEK